MNLQGGGGGIWAWIRALPVDIAPKRRGRREREKKLAIGIDSQLKEESYPSWTEGARGGQRRARAACAFPGGWDGGTVLASPSSSSKLRSTEQPSLPQGFPVMPWLKLPRVVMEQAEGEQRGVGSASSGSQGRTWDTGMIQKKQGWTRCVGPSQRAASCFWSD